MLRVSVDEAPKVALDQLIDSFSLPVRLGVICHAKIELRAIHTEDRLPEDGRESIGS